MGGGLRINTRGGDSFVGAQGQLTKALIIRHVEGERQVLSFDLSFLQESGSHDSDTPVIPGDIVYVPEAVNLVYLLGEVRRPSVFQLTEGMTLLQLLTRAGGVIETTGKMRRVIIMREIDENETRIDLVNVKTILSTGLDPRLLAGDIIYVPRKRLVRLSTFVAQFTSSISPILNLYKNAYDTYFTPERFRRLFRDDDASGGLLEAQQVLRDVTALTTGIP